MKDYTLLKDEIETDPTNLGLSSLSGFPLRDTLNLVGIPVKKELDVKTIDALLQRKGVFPAAEGIINDPAADPAIKNVLKTLDKFVRLEKIDSTDPMVAQISSLLVSLGLLTQTDVDGLLSSADTSVSRAEQIGFGMVTMADLVMTGYAGSFSGGDVLRKIVILDGQDSPSLRFTALMKYARHPNDWMFMVNGALESSDPLCSHDELDLLRAGMLKEETIIYSSPSSGFTDPAKSSLEDVWTTNQDKLSSAPEKWSGFMMSWNGSFWG